jgi:hypothetical protein
MSNCEGVWQLKILRHAACGIGTRALKPRLNKLVKAAPGALTRGHGVRRMLRAVKRYGGSERPVAL